MIRYTTVKEKRQNASNSVKTPSSTGEVDIAHEGGPGGSIFKTMSIRPGIKMIFADHEVGQRLEMDYEIDLAPISLSYAMSQRIRSTMTSGPRGKTVIERSPGDSVLAYLPKTRGTNQILSKGRLLGVSFHFSPQVFYELFTDLPGCLKGLCSVSGTPKGQRFYQQSRFDKETLLVLKQILVCPYEGEIQRLYFESKALELVALKLAELEQGHRVPDSNRRDLDRAREAYHILLSDLDHPPSLIDLSRRVGINRNKLNQEFKALYGDTVFNVLRNARLSEAWSLLKQSDKSLSEIAFSVGYNNQSNFTTAFRKEFGKTPKEVRQDVAVEPLPPHVRKPALAR